MVDGPSPSGPLPLDGGRFRDGGAPAASTSPRRIHLTGGPGSGKSTLARRIGLLIDAPVFHLDEMALDLEQSFESLAAFEKLAGQVPSIGSEPRWVSDGAYMGWATPLFEAADLIVWMDVPWRVASYRILTRHLKAEIARSNRFPGWRRLWTFWRWASRYYNDRNPHRLNAYGVPHTRAMAAELLQTYSDKVAVCRGNNDIEAVLARLARGLTTKPLPGDA